MTSTTGTGGGSGTAFSHAVSTMSEAAASKTERMRAFLEMACHADELPGVAGLDEAEQQRVLRETATLAVDLLHVHNRTLKDLAEVLVGTRPPDQPAHGLGSRAVLR